MLLVCTGCMSSPKGLRLVSEPEGAAVSLIQPSGDTKDLGVTPIEFTEAEISAHSSQTFGFKFHKEGYEVERVYASNPSHTFTGELKVKLYPSAEWSQAFVDKKAAKYLDDVAKLTAEVQGSVAAGDLNLSEQKARSLTSRYPNLSVGWSLLGNVLYKQNRRSEALEAYNKSLGIDPSNNEIRMVIEKMRGG